MSQEKPDAYVAPLERIARAVLGDREFTVSRYEKGQSKSHFEYAHDRITLNESIAKPQSAAAEVMKTIKEALGNNQGPVKLDYGADATEQRPFVALFSEEGHLTAKQLEEAARKIEHIKRGSHRARAEREVTTLSR